MVLKRKKNAPKKSATLGKPFSKVLLTPYSYESLLPIIIISKNVNFVTGIFSTLILIFYLSCQPMPLKIEEKPVNPIDSSIFTSSPLAPLVSQERLSAMITKYQEHAHLTVHLLVYLGGRREAQPVTQASGKFRQISANLLLEQSV